MDRSQSILKSLVAATLLSAGLLSAEFAMAQRAISASRNGNDTSMPRYGTALVGGDVSNTAATNNGLISGGKADVFSVTSLVESDAAARSLAAGYGGLPNSAYTLSLAANPIPDRAIANGLSSGGLFSLSGVGQGAVTLAFQRDQDDDFVFAFSGSYPVFTGLANEQRAWSAYYLFDDVRVEKDDGIGTVEGYMNFELFERNSFFELEGSVLVERFTRDYTTGLVVNQVSIYTLERTPKPNGVPEPGSLALAGLSLALLAAARRLRRSTRA